MYCYHHPDREAVGQCIECGKTVCPECKVVFDGKIYCNSCIAKKISTTGAGTPVAQSGNTSGMGSGAAVPPGWASLIGVDSANLDVGHRQ